MMKSLLRRRAIVLIRAVVSLSMASSLAILSVACAQSSDPPAVTGEATAKYVFTFPGVGTDSTGIDAIALANKKGWFAEEGIEIRDAGAIAIPEFVPALLSGSITGATLMTSNGIAANDNGADLVQVAVNSYTTKDRPHMIFVVAKDSPIKKATDLVGKRIAVPALDGCNSGFPLEYLKQGGVNEPSKAITFITMPPEAVVTALERGEADVAGLHVTLEQTATLYPDVRVLFTDYDILGTKGGDISYWFPRSYVEQNEDAIAAFVRVVAKTNNWMLDNPEEALEYYQTEVNPQANKELISAPHWAEDALIDPSHIQVWIDILSEKDSFQEPLKSIPDLESLYTNEYNPLSKN
ncbi:MAG: ABC transporter substrate-binding protein [Coriobacteriaceae bacterium]|jgi:ABC-type nitrate/sulfonate/bicarbonate transport system substrate-binding protein|nr:ABC transporter substrate-binding protein [Coriobacteriaceae bacterium]